MNIRSPAAYRALQSFQILNLPSKSTLQAYTGWVIILFVAHLATCNMSNYLGTFLSGPGASEESIQKQAILYKAFKDEQLDKHAHEPKGESALIFDEVKVVSCLLWNSRNQEIIGLAMNPDDVSSLHDVYASLGDEQPQQVSYMLQFVWRDLTSSFDIIGPYYSSSESLKSKFILACVYEVMKISNFMGFKHRYWYVMVLVQI